MTRSRRYSGAFGGTLAEGSLGDVTIVDPDSRYQITNTFRSKASNSPFIGETVHGRVIATIVGGELRYDEREAVAPAPKKRSRK